MNKILSFIANKDKLLLLQGSPNDPQYKKSLWYVVTGGYEEFDYTLENTVIREVKEETNLIVNEMIYLNWIFKYNSLGKECTEYAYISFVNNTFVKLNEESIGYKWCTIDEFIELIDWIGDKKILKEVIKKALKKEKFWRIEKVEKL